MRPRRSLLDPVIAKWGARDPMFTAGFGDARSLAGRLEPSRAGPVNADDDLGFDAARAGARAVDVRDGAFASPWSSELPPGVGTVHVRWLANRGARAATQRAVIVLAASREEGFAWRERTWRPLTHEGVDVFLLENAFYGARRAPGQRSASLATVADQLRMNLATIAEVEWLLDWLARRGTAHVAVTGFSMGGAIAALVGGIVRRERRFAVVPVAAGRSPAPVYTTGLLSRSVAWSDLARESGSEPAARRALGEILEQASLARLPPPIAADACIVVGCTRDGFVARDETEALALHWGTELRWIAGGHVSGLALGGHVMRRAVLDALARL